jgi:hypothetical protein
MLQSVAAVAPPPLLRPLRDDRWLVRMLDHIWVRHFNDTPRVNHVRVNFGGFWRNRLGLITMTEDSATTYIRINGLFRLPESPEYVTTVTVAHEMVHYAHGFGSPLPRRYKHPHRGGVVKRELLRRGMAYEIEQYDNWVSNHWFDFYAANAVSGRATD